MAGGRCPFGFAAEEDEADISGEEENTEEVDAQAEAKADKNSSPVNDEQAAEKKDKKKKKATNKAGDDNRFDVNTDPVSWFYQNQIKSEEEFQQKKEQLRAEAKKRLDAIMDKKNKRLMWPSDSEFDELSISSGELSELDSDVHSLASLRSCANSWVEDSKYKAPAEQTVRWVAFLAIIVSFWSLYTGYDTMQTTRKALGLLTNSNWPMYGMLAAVLMSGGAALNMLSSQWRSKRLLLAAQVMHAVTYATAAAVCILIWAKPVKVDTKIKEGFCSMASGRSEPMSRICRTLPATQGELMSGMKMLQWCMAALAFLAVVLLGVGAWYTFELCFIEKKAVKHVRRHKRRKHTIPWEKIKIVGPVTNCGANTQPSGKGGAAAGGGKCPVGFGGGGKNKDI